MNRSAWFGLVVGLLFGAGGIIAIGAFADGSGTAVTTAGPAAAETTSTSRGPVWIEPVETIVGPAVLLPGGLARDGDQVVFRYELATLSPLADIERAWGLVSPQSGIAPIDPADIDPVFPVQWSLVTAGGTISGETGNPSARAARFDVAVGFQLDSVESVRIDAYRLPVPVNVEFELSSGTPLVEVAPGVAVSLSSVVDQAGQTIVQVEIVSDVSLNRENLTIEGVGPEWRSAVREAEGRPRYNLRYGGTDIPGPMVLRARGYVWLPVHASIDVAIGVGQ